MDALDVIFIDVIADLRRARFIDTAADLLVALFQVLRLLGDPRRIFLQNLTQHSGDCLRILPRLLQFVGI